MNNITVNTNIANPPGSAIAPLNSLFAVPTGALLPELHDVANDARAQFEEYAAATAKAPVLTMEQLRANVAALAPTLRHFLPQTLSINMDYLPIG